MFKVEIGINFNGDLSPKYIVKGSKIAEVSGYHYIWIGEAIEYMHPFPIIVLVSQGTKNIKIGASLSPQINQCYHIISAYRALQEVYGNRFVVGLAPGDIKGLKIINALTNQPLKKVKNCVMDFRKSLLSERLVTLPIYVGASGPKMVETGSKIADGVLMNYIYPKFLKWALKFFTGRICSKVAFGPSLLNPDRKNLQLLRISAAIIVSGANKAFLEEFGLEKTSLEVNEILKNKQFHKLKIYDDIILDKFAIYGSLRDIEERIEELKVLGIDQIVFSSPLCRNLSSVKKISETFTNKEDHCSSQ